MFRHKRAASNPPRGAATPPSAAASLAAAQAFLANRASNADLSNAAATAALRAFPAPPTPVGQVQTRRMQRRGSVSSSGSAPARPGGLQRRDSGGSMTERSFRDPSPSRPASSHGPYPRYDNEAPPPVPALPKNLLTTSPLPQKSNQRPASVASTRPPERVKSPTPRQAKGLGGTAIVGGSKPATISTGNAGEVDRPGTRGSINFSRPISPQNSPEASPMAVRRIGSPTPGSTSIQALPNGEAERIISSLEATAARPVKKKKKALAQGSAEGSHLALGTTGGAPRGTAIESTLRPVSTTSSPISTGSPSSAGAESPRPKMKKKKKIAQPQDSQSQGGGEGFGSAYPSDTDSVMSERSSTTERPRSFTTRAAGILAKQPSIVREDREAEEKAEHRIPRSLPYDQSAPNGNVVSGTPANTSKVVSKDRPQSRGVGSSSSPKTTKSPSTLDAQSMRPTSLSPARAAHFSSQLVHETFEGTKHQPPGRSVSPAKSALKHSPSRGHSPALKRNQILSPSEASDTASGLSDDASRSSKKKKKVVRVSFDDNSSSTGRAASPATTVHSPIAVSSQNKSESKKSIDLDRDTKAKQGLQGDDQDASIKPIPTLPSFGSVRGRSDNAISQSTEQLTPSEDWAENTLKSLDSSSDQVLGGILSQHAAEKETSTALNLTPKLSSNDPLPPDVTSVEGTGYHSDDDESIDIQKGSGFSEQSEGPSQNSEVSGAMNIPTISPTIRTPAAERNASVPSIALQPATPGVDENPATHDEWLRMPGEFPTTDESHENQQTHTTSETEQPAPTISPATVGIAEPKPEAAAAQQDLKTPAVGEVADSLRAQIESDAGEESEASTGESIYSDAAEDPSDIEGDGFGSINAIVESPATPVFAAPGKSPPASPIEKGAKDKAQRPSLKKTSSQTSEPMTEEGWDQAQAYWSSLSQTKKQQLELAALPGAIDEPPGSNKTMRGIDSVAKRRKAKKNPVTYNDPPSPGRQNQKDVTRRASPKAPILNASMRGLQNKDTEQPHMRMSMRDREPAKSSSRNVTGQNTLQVPQESKKALQKKTRPVSAVAMVNYNKAAAVSTTNRVRAASANAASGSLTAVPAQSRTAKPAAVPNLRRAKSNGSDSSSSFKRLRTSSPDANKYAMKRTMRGSAGSPTPMSSSGNRASSISGRTSSPIGSVTRRPFSSGGLGSMRTSMRDSAGAAKPPRLSLRESMDSGKASRTKSPSRFSFTKGSKPKPIESKSASRYSSRFDDSSDEESGLPAMRGSRFADSSDDEPAGLAPVRGIPRRIDEGDSTDLEDSSVENVPLPKNGNGNGKALAPQTAASTNPEGLALAAGSLRAPIDGKGPTLEMGSGLHAKKAAEKEKKKRSFFGVLGGRKRDDSSRVPKADIESAARRDTPLERTKAEQNLGSNGANAGEQDLATTPPRGDAAAPNVATGLAGSPQASPRSPKLQRRNTPREMTNGSGTPWPLPQSPGGSPSVMNSRPQTSDGPASGKAAGRPDIGTRRVTVEGANGPVLPAVIGRSGKKKKFPMLRKAFGLHD